MEKSEYQEVKKAVMLVSAAIVITVLTIILTRSDALQKPVKPVISAQTAGTSAGAWREISGIRQGNDEFTAVAVDDQNRIYAGMKSSKYGSFYIAVFASDGKLLETIPVDAQASSLAATTDGVIYAASENQISVISPVSGSRQIKKWQQLGSKAILTSLAADDKHVFAADAGNRLVYVYDRDGRLTNTVKGTDGFTIHSPCFDVAADGSGGFWAADTGRHQLENYTADGRFIAVWQAEKDNGFLGCCNPAHFQLMSKGRIVTSEKGLVRIRVFGPDGKLDSEVCGPEAFEPGSTYGHNIAVDGKDRIIVLDPAEKALRIFVHEKNKGNVQ
ncbi:MAG: hypothetical protein WCV67_06670 [Victivallaceae bacterium]|jgi:DNA-binding beta-propeller fold protein YncE